MKLSANCVRVSFFAIPLILLVAMPVPAAQKAEPSAGKQKRRQVELKSLDPARILDTLDLSGPGLEATQKAKQAGDRSAALTTLLTYYRLKYPLPKTPVSHTRRADQRADEIVKHVFRWGPYEPADYGPTVDWEWDPRGDIEWVAAVYRFYWALPLAEAYRTGGDDTYVKAFVELASSWIAKHPLENRERAHPVYTSWRGFAWLDIQTGNRATAICSVFPALVHGESFTPEFLGILLASLYDHQVKTEVLPMNQVHNKAIFEQRGFVNVCSMFPEFRDSRRWMALAVERTRDTFLAQTTPDGVQREWSFGYNCSVLRDAVDVMRAAEAFGVSLPADYRERVRRMYDYIFSIATPELAGPMFGDASRSPVSSADRSRWSLYSTLTEATTLLDDPKYAALAKLDLDKLPEQTSYAFTHAGTYVLRDQWGPEQVYFALHCPPLGISGHDQPDNGTFELKAYGRWLMPDTGFYTYGHDAKARQWHRQTSVHQTLTLDGKDSKIDGRQLLWKTAPGLDVVTVENPSYPGLVHRRTVWFVQHKFFVILDEAMGEASGKLDLHFQFAPGEARIDAAEHRAATLFPDVNVLVWMDPKAPVTMEEEEGWFAWEYGHRTPRKAFRYRCDGSAPAAMLSVVYPYRGTQPPAVSATVSEAFRVGADRCEILVEFSGQRWQFGRDLDRNEAWGKSRL